MAGGAPGRPWNVKGDEMKKKKNGPSFKERFQYWFDDRMSKGSLGLIRILLIATILVILVIGGIILAAGLADEELGTKGVFWETMSTVINAWMPSFGDGSIGYLILMGIAALAGLLVTSVLIGIFSSAIEEKINNLKNGNSAILEKDHIVILGFVPGEFTLIKQIVDASADNKRCIVVAGDCPKTEMEEAIADNVELPKHVKLVCRSIDVFDPASLAKCHIERAQAVIVNPADDVNTAKALLAVSSILGENNRDVYVLSVVSDSKYLLPAEYARAHNVTQLLANRTLSKVIAHSCTQPGLAQTLMEFLDYDGDNLVEALVEGAGGLTFGELTARLDGGVPIGVFADGQYRLNPTAETKVPEDGKILAFAENETALRLTEAGETPKSGSKGEAAPEKKEKILILGVNEEIGTILQELPENAAFVRIVGADAEEKEKIASVREDIAVEFGGETVPREAGELEPLVREAGHVVVLSDHGAEENEADVDNIMRIVNLRTLRKEKDLSFSITAELRRELSQRLADEGDGTDFVVASNMISLFLSQLADRPELECVFREILSNEGNELYLKEAASLGLSGTVTVREARSAALSDGYVLLGFLTDEDGRLVSSFNPGLDESVDLAGKRLIVLGEH